MRSDDNFSHNTVGIVGPEHHDVIIHEIVKEPGERVSNEELNNAINVDNKDHANVNEGVSLPTNLQSDTTQTVPTRITYRDGSIEIVNVPEPMQINRALEMLYLNLTHKETLMVKHHQV